MLFTTASVFMEFEWDAAPAVLSLLETPIVTTAVSGTALTTALSDAVTVREAAKAFEPVKAHLATAPARTMRETRKTTNTTNITDF